MTFGSIVSVMKITDAGEDVKKEEPSFTVDWRVTWNGNFGHQWGGTQKVKNNVPVTALLDKYQRAPP